MAVAADVNRVGILYHLRTLGRGGFVTSEDTGDENGHSYRPAITPKGRQLLTLIETASLLGQAADDGP
jgi:hypothetical protein